MSWLPLLSVSLLCFGQAADKPTAPPLSEEQAKQLRELVRVTQETTSKLQSELEEKQRALALVYAEYELNEKQAQKLEAEIVELQRQLLAAHHKMQTDLRTIVGKERFEILRQRLQRVLAPPGKDKEPPATRKTDR